eukprot:5588945-Lingulodinium_polyedra.AAC.1
MMRSSRPSAVVAARKSRASRISCERQFWRSFGVCEVCDLRSVAAANGRIDRIIVQRLQNATQ